MPEHDHAQEPGSHTQGSNGQFDMHRPLPSEAEIVVIGGGAAGCAAAYQLSKRGKKVVLVEMRGICSGASGRNGGMTGSGSKMYTRVGEAVYGLTSENFRLIRDELPQELGEDFSLRVTGTLDIAMNEEQWEYLKSTYAARAEHGSEDRLLDRQELRALAPMVTADAFGAVDAPNAGHLWPFALVNALANGARKNGALVYPWTAVESILTANGAVTGVQTSRGVIATDTVVVATNAWAPFLLSDLPERAVVPARGQILVTEAVGPILPKPFGNNYDKEYGRQTATGQILFGGFRRLDVDEGLGHYEEDVTAPVIAGMAERLYSIFPIIRNLRVVRVWSGIMGFTADGLPLIGPYDAAKGIWVSAGYNGGGFSFTQAAAKAVAQCLAGETCEFDLEPFNPNRFAGKDVGWHNPFTAGEKNNPDAHTGEYASAATDDAR